jgi:hypothetical protein
VFGVDPLTVILDEVDEPVRPDGRDHAYCVALLTPATVTDADPVDEQKFTAAILPPPGVATIFTVPVICEPVHVIPDATSCAVTLTVYDPAVAPDTVMVDEVDEPVRPDGNDHAYCVALLTPVTDTVAEPADEQ